MLGVPKIGAKALKSLEEFKDDFLFSYDYTNKNTLFYCEYQTPFNLTDHKGNKYKVSDFSGCCLVPTSYTLSKALEYSNLINNTSNRAIYKKGDD